MERFLSALLCFCFVLSLCMWRKSNYKQTHYRLFYNRTTVMICEASSPVITWCVRGYLQVMWHAHYVWWLNIQIAYYLVLCSRLFASHVALTLCQMTRYANCILFAVVFLGYLQVMWHALYVRWLSMQIAFYLLLFF